MRKVKREEVVDYQTYTEGRDAFRDEVLEQKATRRVHLGPYLTFLFENHSTILYQIQEMMRVEQIVKEKDVQHEIDTYNGLLGETGELGCTLLIEIPTPAERDKLLVEWLGIEKCLYLLSDKNEKCYAIYDEKQVGESRLSSVQYLKFKLGDGLPVAIGCDFEKYNKEEVLTAKQKEALSLDLK